MGCRKYIGGRLNALLSICLVYLKCKVRDVADQTVNKQSDINRHAQNHAPSTPSCGRNSSLSNCAFLPFSKTFVG